MNLSGLQKPKIGYITLTDSPLGSGNGRGEGKSK